MFATRRRSRHAFRPTLDMLPSRLLLSDYTSPETDPGDEPPIDPPPADCGDTGEDNPSDNPPPPPEDPGM